MNKTMDYKEKYEMALEGIQEILSSGQDSIKMSTLQLRLQGIFPELAESEDERIRKEIVRFIQMEVEDEIVGNKWLAWLGKKAEQKPAWKSSGEQMIEDIIDAELDDVVKCLINGMKFYYEDNEEATWGTDKWSMPVKHIIEVLEKQGKQKPAENKGMNLVEEEMTPFQKKVFCIVDTAIEKEQGLSNICNELLALAKQEIEQKPTTWSEGDEEMLNQVIGDIVKLAGPYVCYHKDVDWLKSLKNKVGCEANCTTMWKPTDEQMDALKKVILCGASVVECGELNNLYEDLKKLRRETKS